MQAFITAIGTAAGSYKTSQSEICRFMTRSLQLNEEEERKLKALYKATGILHRYSVIPDYGNEVEEYQFYPKSINLEPIPSTFERLSKFREKVIDLSKNAIFNCLHSADQIHLEDITHLITVSCTGMYAPGLDIDLINELRLNTTVKRTAINFMGCYAAFNALKVARAFCESEDNAKVLVVCVEMCSLHFQNSKENDHLLSAALFGDGAAALLVESNPGKGVNLKFEGEHCELYSDYGENMAWNIGDHGFEMRLSNYIPDLIKNGISELVDKLMEKSTFSYENISHFAIHPGGKKILDVVEKQLGICHEKNCASHAVLAEYGNMSSPTIIFVIEKIRNGLTHKNVGDKLISLAFGPGLTLESFLFKVV